MHTRRIPGLAWFKLPLFVWAIYATSLILVIATPVLAITTLLAVASGLLKPRSGQVLIDGGDSTWDRPEHYARATVT